MKETNKAKSSKHDTGYDKIRFYDSGKSARYTASIGGDRKSFYVSQRNTKEQAFMRALKYIGLYRKHLMFSPNTNTGLRGVSFINSKQSHYRGTNYNGIRKNFYINSKRTKEEALADAYMYANN